jgi:hypothetical protein
MSEFAICKRCSLTRVNLLSDLYDQAFGELSGAADGCLRRLVALAGERGYADGHRMLAPGLPRSTVRALCWNVSSVLTDEDVNRVCPGVDGRR